MHWADAQGLALLDLKDLQATIAYLVSDEGKPQLKGIGGPVGGDRRGDPARDRRAAGAGRRRVLRRAGVRRRGAAAHRAGRARRRQRARAARRAGPAGALLDVPHVAARRAVPGAARGGRPGQAPAGLLLRRGAPAVHRRVDGLPHAGDADRPADPLEGRRRLLRHAEPQGRPRATCSPSSATGCSTRCARSRPDDAKALRAAARTFPTSPYDLEAAADLAGHGRGRGDRAVGERGRPDARWRGPGCAPRSRRWTRRPRPTWRLRSRRRPLAARYARGRGPRVRVRAARRARRTQRAAERSPPTQAAKEAAEAQAHAPEADKIAQQRPSEARSPRSRTSRTSPLDVPAALGRHPARARDHADGLRYAPTLSRRRGRDEVPIRPRVSHHPEARAATCQIDVRRDRPGSRSPRPRAAIRRPRPPRPDAHHGVRPTPTWSR